LFVQEAGWLDGRRRPGRRVKAEPAVSWCVSPPQSDAVACSAGCGNALGRLVDGSAFQFASQEVLGSNVVFAGVPHGIAQLHRGLPAGLQHVDLLAGAIA
jgi:hypothetical protein